MCGSCAEAASVDYHYTSGQATVTASVGASIIGSATLTLNGVSADFDATTGDLTNFNFTTSPNQWIVLNTPFGGFDQVWINSARSCRAPAGTLATTPLGPGHWDVSVLPVVVNAVYTAKNSVTLARVGPIPLSYTNSTPLNATIDVVTGTFTLQGITLGVVSVPGEANPLVVGANIKFSGVLEPASASMLVLAGLGLALTRMRSKSQDETATHGSPGRLAVRHFIGSGAEPRHPHGHGRARAERPERQLRLPCGLRRLSSQHRTSCSPAPRRPPSGRSRSPTWEPARGRTPGATSRP